MRDVMPSEGSFGQPGMLPRDQTCARVLGPDQGLFSRPGRRVPQGLSVLATHAMMPGYAGSGARHVRRQ